MNKDEFEQSINSVLTENILENPDAMSWARHFIEVRRLWATQGVDIADDEGFMVGWFANAFQRGEWSSPHYQKWAENYINEFIAQGDNTLILKDEE